MPTKKLVKLPVGVDIARLFDCAGNPVHSSAGNSLRLMVSAQSTPQCVMDRSVEVVEVSDMQQVLLPPLACLPNR